MRAPKEEAKNLNAFKMSMFYRFKPHVAAGGEFSAGFGSAQIGTTTDVSLKRYLYLFGPQFNFQPKNNDKVNPFVHTLFGGVHDTTKKTVGTTSTSFSANAFAMAFGGGVDVNLNKRFAIRPFQFDYVLTRFGGQLQNNVMVSSGLVYTFGRK